MSGLDKAFDYLVPPALAGQVRVGALVRVPLHGRRVGGWVIGLGGEAPPGVALKPIAKVTGWGPPGELLALAEWAAWRWAGPERAVLTTASPPVAVRGLPPARPPARLAHGATAGAGAGAGEPWLATLAADAFARDRAVVRLPPAADPLALVLAAAARGHALVVTPSVESARRLAARARSTGVPVALHPRDWAIGAAGATVIGARASVWAPVGGLAAVLVLDEHDEALHEERVPTWDAAFVALERGRRAGVPCVLASPCPSLETLAAAPLLVPARADERAGWPLLEVVDRRADDPRRSSLVTDALLRHLRSDARVVCVLNTTGRGRLLACDRCGELARCEVCAAAVEQPDDTRLRCRRCGTERPVVCLVDGATRFRVVRPGVSRLRDELAAAAGTAVVEVTAKTPDEDLAPGARIHVGTEAVLHRLSEADVVAFLDLDQELNAPRYRAGEQALGLLARAARLVGGRADGGRLLVQTRTPRHEVLDAVLHADPGRLVAVEAPRRAALGFPPVRALAAITGASAGDYAAGLLAVGADVLGPADGAYLVRAADGDALAHTLASVGRPPGTRVEVGPRRV